MSGLMRDNGAGDEIAVAPLRLRGMQDSSSGVLEGGLANSRGSLALRAFELRSNRGTRSKK